MNKLDLLKFIILNNIESQWTTNEDVILSIPFKLLPEFFKLISKPLEFLGGGLNDGAMSYMNVSGYFDINTEGEGDSGCLNVPMKRLCETCQIDYNSTFKDIAS